MEWAFFWQESVNDSGKGKNGTTQQTKEVKWFSVKFSNLQYNFSTRCLSFMLHVNNNNKPAPSKSSVSENLASSRRRTLLLKAGRRWKVTYISILCGQKGRSTRRGRKSGETSTLDVMTFCT